MQSSQSLNSKTSDWPIMHSGILHFQHSIVNLKRYKQAVVLQAYLSKLEGNSTSAIRCAAQNLFGWFDGRTHSIGGLPCLIKSTQQGLEFYCHHMSSLSGRSSARPIQSNIMTLSESSLDAIRKLSCRRMKEMKLLEVCVPTGSPSVMMITRTGLRSAFCVAGPMTNGCIIFLSSMVPIGVKPLNVACI